MMLLKTPAVPPTNIENKMFAGKIPNPLPVSNPDPAERQLMIQTYKRERDEDGDNQDDLRGSSEYLFEYSRVDIITDVYYDPFTSAFSEAICWTLLPLTMHLFRGEEWRSPGS